MPFSAYIFILIILQFPQLFSGLSTCSIKFSNDICVVDSIEDLANKAFYCNSDMLFSCLVINQQVRRTFEAELDLRYLPCTFYTLLLFNINMISTRSKIINREKMLDLLEISNSNFKFQEDKEHNFFSNINYSIIFKHDIRYFSGLRPTIFTNSSIDYISLYGLSNSTIKRNYFTFENESYNLNSKINRIRLNLFKVKLSGDILNENVFEQTNTIFIEQQIAGIETDTFKPLKRLKRLELMMVSFYNFFHQGTSWMRNLNSDVQIDLNTLKNSKNLTEFGEPFKLVFAQSWFAFPYNFPDEDFCLFNNFPHEHYVIPLSTICSDTCTFQWMIKYKYLYEPFEEICSFTKVCDFDLLNSLCINNFKSNTYQSSWNELDDGLNNKIDLYYFYDKNYKIKAYNFILSTVLFPTICFLGIVLNGLNVLVLKNNTYKKEMKEKMYEQMKYSSLINTVICLIYLFRITIKCIDPIGYFCLIEVITNKTLRYLILTLTNYFGNVFRTCSNIIHILIAFHRFALTSNTKSPLSNIILNSSIFALLLYSFIFSCLLNSIKIFEFNYELNYLFPLRFPTLSRNYFSFADVYAYFNLLNIILCDFFYLLLQLIFDLKLLIFVQFSMSSKRLIISNQKNMKMSAGNTTEKKIKLMIILNGLFLFLIHSPNLVISIYSTTIYGHNMDVAGSDQVDEQGLFLFGFLYSEISDCIYFLGYLSDFVFYFYFNKVFRRSLRDLFTPKIN
jgi:hypothetical protein